MCIAGHKAAPFPFAVHLRAADELMTPVDNLGEECWLKREEDIQALSMHPLPNTP